MSITETVSNKRDLDELLNPTYKLLEKYNTAKAKTYDVVIVGSGIAGLMFAYNLHKNNKDIKICIVDKGNSFEDRKCPVKVTDNCIKCNRCSIMTGVGGCGAFSDAKFNISTEYGGWLSDYIGESNALYYMNKVLNILNEFKTDDNENIKWYTPDNEIYKLCIQHDVQLLRGTVCHFGTDGIYSTMKEFISYVSENCDIYSEMEMISLFTDEKFIVCKNFLNDNIPIYYNKLIFATGRSGSEFLAKICKDNRIKINNNQIDIGVRVELPRIVWESISSKIYEPKIIYKTKKYGDMVRTFCFNSGGEVVTENNNGILTVNGHANSDEKLKTENSNFAILNTIHFTEPFNEPIEYLKHISKTANMLGGGNIIVQRYGDLVSGQRTNSVRLSRSRVTPTLSCAIPGDLSFAIPMRILLNIIETIEKLNDIAPGTSNDDTLLYGVEAKHYSIRPEFINDNFEISKDIFAIGDSSGVTRSLSQAGAMGLYLSDRIN